MTVAMPVFNAGRYLRPAVMSILGQTFRDWELLVIDDGSTDGAVESISDIADPRICVINNPRNIGLAATLNVGIDLARGEYFARMDQDDISYPERLATQVDLLKRHPEIDLLAARCVAIDADNKLVGALPYALTHEELCANPWRGFYLAHPTWMGKLAWFRRYRYASPGPYLCEDQELLLRAYSSSHYATTSQILFAYRVRQRVDWRKAFRTRRTIMMIQVRYFLGVRRWSFALLAMVVFIARIVGDSLNILTQSRLAQLKRYHSVAVDAGERAHWLKVLAAIELAGS